MDFMKAMEPILMPANTNGERLLTKTLLLDKIKDLSER